LKPPPFEYDDPRTLSDALSLLAEHGHDAKVLAGGQSLVRLLNFRLARPERLIDINGVSELDYLRVEDGVMRIGALARHSAVERFVEAAERVPLLTEAVRLVGHVQIRNRGTVGGSVAHADPAAELPVAFTALEARFRVRSAAGERELGSGELFVTHLTTSLRADRTKWRPEIASQFQQRTGTDPDELFPVEDLFVMHRVPFRAGITHVENIGGDIEQALDRRCLIGAFPIPIEGGEASPCRVVAFLGD
jgi:molybdopterin-dependent oxidoreductase-like protein